MMDYVLVCVLWWTFTQSLLCRMYSSVVDIYCTVKGGLCSGVVCCVLVWCGVWCQKAGDHLISCAASGKTTPLTTLKMTIIMTIISTMTIIIIMMTIIMVIVIIAIILISDSERVWKKDLWGPRRYSL